MSERDDNDIMFFTSVLVVLIALAWGAFKMSGEIRDLQRRVGQLELEQRSPASRLPEVGEAHWCLDCAAGNPCGRGPGVWLRKIANGQYICFASRAR